MDHVAASPTVSSEAVDKYERITQANAKASPLLRLPGELRNKIYQYTLTDSFIKPSQPLWASVLNGRRRNFPAKGIYTTVSLHNTCRQIRYEALPLVFSLTTFSFSCPDDLYGFLSFIGSAKRESITSISVNYGLLSVLGDNDPGDESDEESDKDQDGVKLPQLVNVHLRFPFTEHDEDIKVYAVLLEFNSGCKKLTFTPELRFRQ